MVPTHDEVMAKTTEHHELQRWRAAKTVRSHVSPAQGQDALLECLGLQDLVPPPGQRA
ncbi:MAG: hypothetical protein JWL64_2486 [Frankiales bacterium]|jgi:hypothetical protein|nr:hypothetical protein [Frankiales bacterium]